MRKNNCLKQKQNKTTRTLKQDIEFIDNMFNEIDKKIKLDDEQKQIILADENNIMVIAGAGSGKTTTISAKVNYLINRKKIKDDEILVISYTNKAVEELQQRINIDFNHNIKIVTFHKFGYEIIKSNTKSYPKINNNPTKIIEEYINNNVKKTTQRKKQELIDICVSFIKLYKSKGYNKNDLNLIRNKIHKKQTELIKKMYLYYQKELEQKNEIDFEDIINIAIKKVKESSLQAIKYKYIIVDEYQDISENRYELIRKISEKKHNKTIVVGDDWQCIYSFASSNINLFINYEKNIMNTKIYKITKTYRNSQQLIDIAGSFIQKNKIQIKKNLISAKRLEKPITIVKYKENAMKKKLYETLDYLISKYDNKKNILILGRYTYDKNKIIDNEILTEENSRIIYKNNNEIEIKYMTIHASKGLGYDNVILINAINKKMGFPSKKKQKKY